MKGSSLDLLPFGTIIKHGKRIYCVQKGLDGVIVVDVNNSIWQFIKHLKWKTFKVLYLPDFQDINLNRKI